VSSCKDYWQIARVTRNTSHSTLSATRPAREQAGPRGGVCGTENACPYPTPRTLTEAQTPPNDIIEQLFPKYNRIVVPGTMGQILRLMPEAYAPTAPFLCCEQVGPSFSSARRRNEQGKKKAAASPVAFPSPPKAERK